MTGSTNFHRRIDDLERSFIIGVCDVCAQWGPSVLVEIDGETNKELKRDPPRTCPNCGRDHITIREIHLILDDSDRIQEVNHATD